MNVVGGGGFGLVQWTPKSSLINHAAALGISDYNNGDNQCQVVIQEIIGSSSIREWYTTSAFISNYYNSGATSDMIGITGGQFISNSMGWTADKLAIMFMAGYERPSYDPSVNHYQTRMSNALAWKQYMGGIIPPRTNWTCTCWKRGTSIFKIWWLLWNTIRIYKYIKWRTKQGRFSDGGTGIDPCWCRFRKNKSAYS